MHSVFGCLSYLQGRNWLPRVDCFSFPPSPQNLCTNLSAASLLCNILCAVFCL